MGDPFSAIPPAGQHDPHHQTEVERYNARLGMMLFLIYSSIYAAFVAITAWNWKWMTVEVIAGLNLAVVYGMGLIFGAFVMALIYLWWARD
jgi:uncharacterized membrane protein (DUF485 family)